VSLRKGRASFRIWLKGWQPQGVDANLMLVLEVALQRILAGIKLLTAI